MTRALFDSRGVAFIVQTHEEVEGFAPDCVSSLTIIEDNVQIGERCSIWFFSHIRKGVVIGDDCIIGKGVFIDCNVRIGSRVKIQNNVSIFHGVTIEDGVFVGPHVCFTNDRFPRAINPDGSLQSGADWKVLPTAVRKGASIGANATILPGIVIGERAMIGAGSVVTKNVPEDEIWVGNPAKRIRRIP